MENIVIKGNRGRSEIFFDKALSDLCHFSSLDKTVVITDSNVDALFARYFDGYKKIVIKPGESEKNLETAAIVYKKLLGIGIDRSCSLVGIGGGIVCDLTGFIASTYLRGLRFGFIPTTLLAQIDASVGGKNGVNFDGYKNIIGTFCQPSFVICDPKTLCSLPPEELIAGFSETIKHALIKNRDYYDFLKSNCTKALDLDYRVMKELIFRSVKIKAGVVEEDETEQGQRKILNFGHTFGHALEKTLKIPHGAAVCLGMVAALKVSAHQKLISRETVSEIISLMEAYHLDTTLSWNKEAVLAAVVKDKKRHGSDLDLVLLTGIGEAVISRMDLGELKEVIYDLY